MKQIFTLLFAVLAFTACTQNDVEELSANRADVPEILTIGFESDDTRIQLEAGKTVWTSGDLVSVFYKSDANQQWEYRGETGARVADLYCVDKGVESSKMNYVVVAYPYNPDYIISTASGNIETTLPAVQHYAEESYGVGENLMVSRSEFTQFSLKSVCGWLKIQLTGNGEKVQSITLRGNNEEQVAGLIYVDTATAESTLASEEGDSSDNNAGGNLVFDDTIVTELTLDCGEGVVLGAEATSFYFALPPQTFEGGFTVDVECEDYEPMVISTENRITIQRNTIQPMATIELDADAINDTIYYTATAKINKNWDFNTFGANILSHEWNSETGEGVITFDANVATIGNRAFYNCSSLTSITIPDSVTTIGEGAFIWCNRLASVIIGKKVETIGESAFSQCYSLTNITIPDSVLEIGAMAFCYCDMLTQLNGKFVSEDGRCLIVNGVLNFFIAKNLTSYNIPYGVTTIGERAFQECRNLTSVTIPNSVTTIEDYAFNLCESFTNIVVPDSVITIGDQAFGHCYDLTEVRIGNGVTEIGSKLFYGCESLRQFTGKYASGDGRCLIKDNTIIAYAEASGTTFSIPYGVEKIGEYAFYDCNNLTSITIPDSVVTIGEEAFSNSNISSAIIGNGLKTISQFAFLGCINLTNITIPDSVTTIGDYAFSSCDSLTSVTIGNSVTTIGRDAFYNCNSLNRIFCKATTPPNLRYAEFDKSVADLRIYVPAESLNLYKTATVWDQYATYFVAYDFENGEVILSNSEIWYTTSYNTNPYNSYREPFDVEIISNTYDSENERWVIKLAGEVTKINDSAFESQGKFMRSITIPESVTEIGNFAFNNCFELKAIDIPKNVTSIGNWAFHYCTSFTSVTIPNSVETIGDYAFAYCEKLAEFKGKFAADNGRCLIVNGDLNAYAIGCNTTQYTIPDGVVSLGERSFAGAVKLTEVVIPSSVNEVCSQAFQDCSSLASLYCESQLPPTFSRDALYGVASNLRIYVPATSVDAYKAATGWSVYADAIVGYDFENSVVVE